MITSERRGGRGRVEAGAGVGAAESARAASIVVDVLVQPRASRAKIGPRHDGRIKIAVTAPPVDGEANAAVIELLAKSLGVAKSAVEVVAGASSRRKTIRIDGVSEAQLEELIA